jgi:type IV fimbrial biogenesis protein FimT
VSPSNASRTAWQTPRQRGFTLLELAITLAVLGIVLAAAIPSMTALINSGRLTANANDILTALHSARVESIRRGQRVVMCPSGDGTTCSNNWNDGWMVFEDRNRDGAPAGESVLYTGNLTPTLTILASSNITTTNRVVFNPDGFARTAGTLLAARFAVCRATARPPENIRDIRITAGSRFTVVRRNGSASCAAIANT